MTQIAINTTQNVQINFKAADVGERILANLLDTLIKIVYGLLIFGLVFNYLNLHERFDSMDRMSVIAIWGIFTIPLMIYNIVSETYFEGQSIGKKVLKIKVVKIDGFQASFGEYLSRWIFRLIDISFFSPIIALIAVSSSKKSQRLGDIVAGTSVISLKNKISINSTILEETGQEYIPTYPQVIKLNDNDMRIIKDSFNNARAVNDYDTINRISVKIQEIIGAKVSSRDDAIFISIVLKDYSHYTQSMI